MAKLIYLSAPYSSCDADVRRRRAEAASVAMTRILASGSLVVCPLVMNHAAFEGTEGAGPDATYWRELEIRLTAACDELVVLTLPDWRESRGVAREIALFEASGRPVAFLNAEPDAPR